MSKTPFPTQNRLGIDRDAFYAITATNGGDSPKSVQYRAVLHQLNKTTKFTDEWFRLKEEEIELRVHHDVQESSFTGLFTDSSTVGKQEVLDILHVEKSNVENISTLERNQHAVKKAIERPSRGKCSHDSSITQQATKIGADDRENNTINAIASNLRAPSSSKSTAKKSDLENDDPEKQAMKIPSIHSRTRQVPRYRDFEDELGPTNWNAGLSNKAAIDTSGISNHELSPAPFGLHSRPFEDGQKAKGNAGIETHRITNDAFPPPPLRTRFANDAITEKLSRVDASINVTNQSVSPSDQSPPAEDFIDTNQCQPLPREDVVRQSRPMRTGINNNNRVPVLSPSAILRDINHPWARIDVPPQSLRSESDQEEEDKEDAVVIHEAFLVEENAPIVFADVEDVGVGEMFEPDPSSKPFTKFHAFVVSLCTVATLLAVGITFYFTRVKSPSIRTTETTEIFSPLPQPPSPLPSSSPSVVMPSLQPSLSVRYEIERNVLQRNVTFDEMGATDVRISALNWITDAVPTNLVASASNLFQRYILALLAFEFSNQDWLSDGSECEWLGVECDVEGHVIKLELNSSSLYGTMPPEIGGLQSLQALLLRGNSLTGTLPSELAYLKDLTVLDLKANNCTGTLPSEIGNLRNLTKLDLMENEFTGSLPTELGSLALLTYLDLSHNSFAGTLPSQIGGLVGLLQLYIEQNLFTGHLPSWVGEMKYLTMLSIYCNQFNGTLPSELGRLTSLTSLLISYNHFTGTFSSQIGDFQDLSQLEVNDNQFTGTFPSEIANNLNLTQFCVSNNNFTGSLPDEVSNDWSCTWYCW